MDDLLYKTAIHESGHVLAHYLTSGHIKDIEFMEIYTDSLAGCGLCEVTNEADSIVIKYNEEGGHKYWFDIFCQQVAGVCAESIIFKENINNGYLEGDLSVFSKNASLCQYCGLFDANNNRNEIFNKLKDDAIQFITKRFGEKENINTIKKLAEALIQKETFHNCKKMLSFEISQIIEKE